MDENERYRVSWLIRISVRPSARDAIRAIAKVERVAMATVIGNAIDEYVTARSTA